MVFDPASVPIENIDKATRKDGVSPSSDLGGLPLQVSIRPDSGIFEALRFSPAHIETELWLDASDASTITVDTGVSQWADKSGNNKHANQSVAGAQPLLVSSAVNNLDAIYFDGIDDVLNGTSSLLSGNDSCSWFIVYKPGSVASSKVCSLFGQSQYLTASTWRVIQYRDYSVSGDPYFAGFANDLTDSAVPTTSTKIAGFSHDGSVATLYRDGTSIASSIKTFSTSDVAYVVGNSVGGSESCDGYICEIVCFNSALNTADRQKIEGYLAHKWGLTGSVPSSHPYKYSHPASNRRLALLDKDGVQCSCQIDVWEHDPVTPANNRAIIVPDVSSVPVAEPVDGDLRIAWDDVQDDNDAYVGDVGSTAAQGVWPSSYKARYGFNHDPSGTAPQLIDSTSNGNAGTSGGTMTSDDLVDADIGQGWQLDGTDDNASVPQLWSTKPTGFTIVAKAAIDAVDAAGVVLEYNDLIHARIRVNNGTNNEVEFATYDTAERTITNTLHTVTDTLVVAITVEENGYLKAYINGVSAGTDVAVGTLAAQATTGRYIGCDRSGANFCGCRVDEVQFIDGALSADEVKVISLALSDDLWSWAAYSGITYAPLRVSIYHSFDIAQLLRLSIEQSVSLPERFSLHHNFRDAETLRKSLYHVFGDMLARRISLHHNFSDALLLRLVNEHRFAVAELLRVANKHDFAITSEVLRKSNYHEMSVKDVDLLRKSLYQVLGVMGAASGDNDLTYSLQCRLEGELVANPSRINIERDIDIYHIDCELKVTGQAEWVEYRRDRDFSVTLDGKVYNLIVTVPTRTRQHGASVYNVLCQSPSVRLGHGWAETVSGELTGRASAIAASLAPGFVIDWQVHDELYGPGEMVAADEYPIEVITRMAAAFKGVVQSDPDGVTLRVIRRPGKCRVDERSSASIDYSLSDALNWFVQSEQPDLRDGYNRYLVTNQSASDNTGLRQETEQVSRTEKRVRGYQVPWTGAFDLSHRGGSWVGIFFGEIEERTIEHEIVKFEDGEGSVQYPIYDWSMAEADGDGWKEHNLGTVTAAEDGTLTSSVPGDSLLSITYTTRCKVWRVRDPRDEQLMLVAEEA